MNHCQMLQMKKSCMNKDKLQVQVISSNIKLTDIFTSIRTKSSLQILCAFYSLVSLIEPESHLEALDDPNWIIAMQEEFRQFERNQV